MILYMKYEVVLPAVIHAIILLQDSAVMENVLDVVGLMVDRIHVRGIMLLAVLYDFYFIVKFPCHTGYISCLLRLLWFFGVEQKGTACTFGHFYSLT